MAKRAASQTLPTLAVTGTHADLGRAMGRAKAPRIRAAVEAMLKMLEEPHVSLAQLADQIAPYVAAAERIYPHLLVELREMAQAAEVPFDLLFRLNCYESNPNPRWPREAAHPPGDERPAGTKDPGTLAAANAGVAAGPDGETEGVASGTGGCTSVVSRSSAGVVVGHTEDSFPEAVDGLYLLDATVTEAHPTTGVARGRFWALNYAQTLPGCAAAVNEHGLIILIDALPDPERHVGAPRHMVSRALLDLPSIDAAIDHLRATERGGGWNYLMVQGDRVANVETTATKVLVHEVRDPGTYAHTNHYLDPGLADPSREPRLNSLARLTRAVELVRPGMHVAQIKGVLSDRQGFPDSICRDRTIGAFVADTAARRFEVCWGEPDEGTWTGYAY